MDRKNTKGYLNFSECSAPNRCQATNSREGAKGTEGFPLFAELGKQKQFPLPHCWEESPTTDVTTQNLSSLPKGFQGQPYTNMCWPVHPVTILRWLFISVELHFIHVFTDLALN